MRRNSASRTKILFDFSALLIITFLWRSYVDILIKILNQASQNIPGVAALRAFRVLRALKAISAIPGWSCSFSLLACWFITKITTLCCEFDSRRDPTKFDLRVGYIVFTVYFWCHNWKKCSWRSKFNHDAERPRTFDLFNLDLWNRIIMCSPNQLLNIKPTILIHL